MNGTAKLEIKLENGTILLRTPKFPWQCSKMGILIKFGTASQKFHLTVIAKIANVLRQNPTESSIPLDRYKDDLEPLIDFYNMKGRGNERANLSTTVTKYWRTGIKVASKRSITLLQASLPDAPIPPEAIPDEFIRAFSKGGLLSAQGGPLRVRLGIHFDVLGLTRKDVTTPDLDQFLGNLNKGSPTGIPMAKPAKDHEESTAKDISSSREHSKLKLRLTPGLTEESPKDEEGHRKLWLSKIESYPETAVIGEAEGAMIYQFPDGWTPDRVELTYAQDPYDVRVPYEQIMTKASKSTFKIWARRNSIEFQRGMAEPKRYRARLERCRINPLRDPEGVIIQLSDILHVYYKAIHQELQNGDLKALRKESFANAIEFIPQELISLLPSHFALHFGVITSDNKIMFRYRSARARIFPNSWEVSGGEIFNGPDYEVDANHRFPHCENGRPSITLFLKNSIYEEYGFPDSDPKDFTLLGFGMEYRSLAPKLLVRYRAPFESAALIENYLPSASDKGKPQSVELTPEGLALAFAKYTPLTPLSKLTAVSALTAKEPENGGKCRLLQDLIASINKQHS